MKWLWSKSASSQPAQAPASSTQKASPAAVHAAILRGIDALERNRADSGLERVPLKMYESEGTQTSGRWIEGSETNYYPHELLDEDEQHLIRLEKTYTIISLVSANPFGLVNYGAPGVEMYERTRIRPMLPKLKPESNLYYVTKGGTYTGEQLEQMCATMADSGWTPEAIDARIGAAVREYRAQTRELMRSAGVEESIKRLNARAYTGFEEHVWKGAGMEREAERYTGCCSEMDKILEQVRLKRFQLALDHALEPCKRA